jgi:hypothetical protein
LREIADVIRVEMRSEVGGEILVWNFERSKSHLRAKSEIEHKLVTVTKLNQPPGVRLRRSYIRATGAQSDDAHFARAEFFGIGKVIMAMLVHVIRSEAADW